MRTLLTFAVLAAAPVQAGVHVTIEAPGVQNSTAGFDYVGVETFDSRPISLGNSFSTDFGTDGVIQAHYSSVQVNAADVFGGAGGTGRYAVAFGDTPYEVTFSQTGEQGLTYFGYWLSALDAGNKVDFFDGDTLVFTYTPDDVLAAVSNKPGYYGNPNAPFAGLNPLQPYVFVNLYFTGGTTFDKLRFFEQPSVGGYESDNHTVGFYNEIGGNPIPEPETWAMFVTGFGMMGFAQRRRRAARA